MHPAISSVSVLLSIMAGWTLIGSANECYNETGDWPIADNDSSSLSVLDCGAAGRPCSLQVFVPLDLSPGGHVIRGCIPSMICQTTTSEIDDFYVFIGCCFEDKCNDFPQNIQMPVEYYQYLRGEYPSRAANGTSPPTVPVQSIVIACVFCTVLLAGIVIIFLILFLLYKRRRPSSMVKQASQDNVATESFKLGDFEESGSGARGNFLRQRTAANEIVLCEKIGQGRYGAVWRGLWFDKNVAVKKFLLSDKESWQREKEIYETSFLRHENILTYLAADQCSQDYSLSLELWMVTDYHSNGSLYDYLVHHSVNERVLLSFTRSIASGMAFLHREIRGSESVKPPIAHRDIKSRNILVKADFTCCIADFGLSVRHDTVKDLVDIVPNTKQGTKRYMAPEVLDETIDTGNFASFQQADIYSIGLVFWEICRRCEVNGMCCDYQLPYYDVVPADPSIKEMRAIVVENGYRPHVEADWKQEIALSQMSDIMKDCWHPTPETRVSAWRITKSLNDVQIKQ